MGQSAEIRLGNHTITEIRRQPDTLQLAHDIVAQRKRELAPIMVGWPDVRFIGSGLSYNTAEVARDVHISLTRCHAFAVSAGELFERSADEIPPVTRDTLLVPISRTGETTEVLRATRKFKRQHPEAHVLGITTNPDSPLKRAYPDTVVVPFEEQSITQTSAFTAMLLVAHELSAIAAGRYKEFERHVSEIGERAYRLIQRIDPRTQEVGAEDVADILVTGRGPRHSLATAARITIKEMARTRTDVDKTMDVPHDTITLVDETYQAITYLSDGARAARPELVVMQKEKDQGAETVFIAERPLPSLKEELAQHGDIFVHTRVPEVVRGPLLHIPAQLLGYYRAMYKGLNPDEPRNLQPVVKYDTK